MADDGAEELEFTELFGLKFLGTSRFPEALRLEFTELFRFEFVEPLDTLASMTDRLDTTE
ncbi:hypothetical protein JCM17380_01670 [Desulfosporosinus burensis]